MKPPSVVSPLSRFMTFKIQDSVLIVCVPRTHSGEKLNKYKPRNLPVSSSDPILIKSPMRSKSFCFLVQLSLTNYLEQTQCQNCNFTQFDYLLQFISNPQNWVQEFFLLGVESISYHPKKKILKIFIFLKIGLIKMCYKKFFFVANFCTNIKNKNKKEYSVTYFPFLN